MLGGHGTLRRMRILRILRNILIAVVAVILLFVGMIAYSFLRTKPLIDGQPLSGGAVQVKDGIVSVGLIPVGNGEFVMIDCGNDPEAKSILAYLQRNNISRDSVKTIFITHGHPDHVAGCRQFPNAQIFAMAPEQGLIEGREAGRSIVGRVMGKRSTGTACDPLFAGRRKLCNAGNVTVTAYLIPGHTDGSAAYLAAGTLYLGDSADAGKDGKLLHAKGMASNDVNQNVTSLQALAVRLKPQASQIQVLEFAHSGPMQGFQPLENFGK